MTLFLSPAGPISQKSWVQATLGRSNIPDLYHKYIENGSQPADSTQNTPEGIERLKTQVRVGDACSTALSFSSSPCPSKPYLQ